MAWTLRISETSKRQLKKLDRSTAQNFLRYLNRLLLEVDDPRQRGKGLTANLTGLPLSRLLLIAADALFISLALWLSFWLRLVHSFNANFLQSLELFLDDAPGLWRRDSNVIPIQPPQILRERFGANLMQEWCSRWRSCQC